MVKIVTATTIEYFLEILSATHLRMAGSACSSEIAVQAPTVLGNYSTSNLGLRNMNDILQKHTHTLIYCPNQRAQLYHRGQKTLPESRSTRSIRYPGELREKLGHHKYDRNNALIISEDHASDCSKRRAERRIIISEDSPESSRSISVSVFPYGLRMMYEDFPSVLHGYIPFLRVGFCGHS